jgi:hypothetical protein
MSIPPPLHSLAHSIEHLLLVHSLATVWCPARDGLHTQLVAGASDDCMHLRPEEADVGLVHGGEARAGTVVPVGLVQPPLLLQELPLSGAAAWCFASAWPICSLASSSRTFVYVAASMGLVEPSCQIVQHSSQGVHNPGS